MRCSSTIERRLVAVALDRSPLDRLDLTRTLVRVDRRVRHTDDDRRPRRTRSTTTAGGLRSRRCCSPRVAADLVGVMQGALDDAVAYVAERRQFGVPVGSFQAVQHLAADALVQIEGARSCCWYAAWAVDRLEPDEALLAAHVAKAYASRAGLAVVEATVQMFGGIAITWEQPRTCACAVPSSTVRSAVTKRCTTPRSRRLRLAHPELV